MKQHLVDDALGVEDGRRPRRARLIGHVDGELLVAADAQEVDVEDVAAHRVALEVLDHDELAAAVDVEVDQGVEAGLAGEGVAQLAPDDGDGHGVLAQAVDDAGDLALGPQAAAGAGAGGAAGVGRDGDLSHRCPTSEDRAGAQFDWERGKHERVRRAADRR